ncbi:MAG: 4Fe-4S binding protein [Deltaproteobacteria bacterium]|nr:4Fe-4S binding protein [Deltaproteobacteria bacterium]
MRIVSVRRISQIFFFSVFLWFCLVTTVGTAWWQLRGWPVNWLLELAPLTAVATVLATGTLYGNLLWALVVIVFTLLLGRFFCGFVCPLGALNQFTGWLGQRGQAVLARVEANRYRPAQAIKYYILFFFLALAFMGSVQTGFLDPLPLVYRSVNLAVLPLTAAGLTGPRFYASVWLIGLLFLGIVALNLWRPRFFCRFVCPLGALLGLLGQLSPWRIGKRDKGACGDCRICEEYCEGACRPAGGIILGECVLCLNCLNRCPAGRITFAGQPSAAGEAPLPDLSRRSLIVSGAGLAVAAMWNVGGLSGNNRNPSLIRPPGSLDEDRFLSRCIRCGQCMRVCPSNIIQPALLESGVQGLWSPLVNYRLGRSGCQITCVACGHVCPTAAIRPLSINEKLGLGEFASQGPIRLGTAFVDRNRCLPWVMDRPCLVCHEVCPVSPKAIFIRTIFKDIRGGHSLAARVQGEAVELAEAPLWQVNLASGDYYLGLAGEPESRLRRIIGALGLRLSLEAPLTEEILAAETQVDIRVRLERPYMDPDRCIGCGMCENECPVVGLRAIRVYSENETRAAAGRLLI